GYGRPNLRLAPDAMQALCAYHWPGNVRELQNIIERLVSLSAGEGETIPLAEIPEEVLACDPGLRFPARPRRTADRPFHEAKAEAISDFERDYLRDLLARHRGNISQATR